MSPSPLALSSTLPSELLSFILTNQAYPTTLIICQQRTDFLASLTKSIEHDSNPPTTPPTEAFSQEVDIQNEPPSTASHHPLLIPTIHQIATSRYISLVFIPTVSHLRAYLAVFPPSTTDKPPEQRFDKPGKKVPLLVIYGIVELHRDTSEWSAQGLGNSLSTLVEAGDRTGRKVVVVEKRMDNGPSGMAAGVGDIGEEDTEEAEQISAARRRAYECWKERVPMLNGSVRRTGVNVEGAGWSGRTVEVGMIISRWFKFRRGNWDGELQD